ncbi:hypothetical protein VCR31J2_730001 [Vibrio coralliirubri]|uniref:Uncharacterized protein n=1 Tax=Vibrio coralliirubri TaxID=1516159 RepID=A0AA86X328_9VIBR|nr:hypothetical protein VCR31J2_730001 [Vibrio coralliirubri]
MTSSQNSDANCFSSSVKPSFGPLLKSARVDCLMLLKVNSLFDFGLMLDFSISVIPMNGFTLAANSRANSELSSR